MLSPSTTFSSSALWTFGARLLVCVSVCVCSGWVGGGEECSVYYRMSSSILDLHLLNLGDVPHPHPHQVPSRYIYPQWKSTAWDLPGCPVVRALSFHCRGHRLYPWQVNQDLRTFLSDTTLSICSILSIPYSEVQIWDGWGNISSHLSPHITPLSTCPASVNVIANNPHMHALFQSPLSPLSCQSLVKFFSKSLLMSLSSQFLSPFFIPASIICHLISLSAASQSDLHFASEPDS